MTETLATTDKPRRPVLTLDGSKPRPPSSRPAAKPAKRALRPAVKESLAKLTELHPQVFPKHGATAPLAIGIREALVERHPDFTSRTLKEALAVFCGRTAYLEVSVEGAQRLDLDGNAAGTVTKGEAGFAAMKLRKRARRKAKGKAP